MKCPLTTELDTMSGTTEEILSGVLSNIRYHSAKCNGLFAGDMNKAFGQKAEYVARQLCLSYYNGWAAFGGDYVPSIKEVEDLVEQNWETFLPQARKIIEQQENNFIGIGSYWPTSIERKISIMNFDSVANELDHIIIDASVIDPSFVKGFDTL